ncbi:DUF3080 domain-containing protein [Vibrio rhodolitus]|uniref:DUF3080 domain-containing protein n=1 Tax=Vibrio rhodolitus TaxID=2231649 RepID=UPI000E0B6881|nr:DUF3080 domain-containing protein [Vibrio rhodolitus]
MRYLTFLLLLLTGCGQYQHPVDNLFADYLSRIANVQDESPLVLPENQTVTLPDKRELIIDIEPVTLGLLDSYELRKCGLFNLIAEKNSVLGKVQDEFREFDFQIALLKGLKHCLTVEVVSPELRQTLASIYSQKQSQFAHYRANLLFTSATMRNQLSSQEWIAIENQITSNQLLRGYHALLLAQQFEQTADAVTITPHQEVLDKNNAMGQLWFSMHNANLKLQLITQQLYKFDSKIVCQAGRDSTKFRYLNNVFNLIYIEQIQPYIARVDAHYFKLEPYIAMLENAHPNYRYPIRDAHNAFRSASLEHVQYWQQLFERCGKKVSR